MLTGIRPEVERASIDLDALPEPRALARELVAVLERAANLDPAARHPSSTELRRDLARLDLVNQTMAADDDIEVFDHFAASARAPAEPTPTRRGLPHSGRTRPIGTPRQQSWERRRPPPYSRSRDGSTAMADAPWCLA